MDAFPDVGWLTRCWVALRGEGSGLLTLVLEELAVTLETECDGQGATGATSNLGLRLVEGSVDVEGVPA